MSFVGDELGDRLFAEASGDADDGLDHELVDVSAGGVLDEFAVDLDVVEWQVLEVVEGAEAGAEVIEREAAAEVAQVLREGLGVGDVGDGGGLGDLEDQVRRVDAGWSAGDRRSLRGVAGRRATCRRC